MGLFKKKKKQENKLMEYLSNQEFSIPQVDEDTFDGLRKKKDPFQDNRFASPMFGNFVKDSPANIDTKGLNDIKTYDAFRDKDKRMKKEDDYSDFKSGMINNQIGAEIMGYQELKNPEKESKVVDSYKPQKSIKSEGFDFSKYEEEEKHEEVEPVEFFDEYEFDDASESSNVKAPILDEKTQYEEALKIIKKYETEHKPQKVEPVQPKIEPKERFFETKEEPKIEQKVVSYKKYKFPPKSIFKKTHFDNHDKPDWINEQILEIDNTLAHFGIDGHVENFTKGPSITRYEIKLEAGVNVKKISTIEDNIKMNLAVKSLRIEAPIPGKPNVGIEVPNIEKTGVPFGNIVNDEFINDGKPLRAAIGMNIEGEPVYVDIAKMPHGLIAGTTGSGKSVSVNTILVSLLLKNTPDDLRLILVDPKQVEFIAYMDLPHLVTPVITDSRLASQALKWTVEEMERRYTIFRDARTRDIKSYNEKILEDPTQKKMPYIVVVIDELADLMNVAADDVNVSLQRLTQKSRAAGIHLLLATQRPTVNVINGTIKTNIPYRMAFRVSSFQDSMVILDQKGAEELLGYGDMLMKSDISLERIQGAFISDDEIYAVVDYIKDQYEPNYIFEAESLQKYVDASNAEIDPLFAEVARYVVENDCASINRIQKVFNLGFNRAQRIFEMLDEYGITGSPANGKQREILVTLDELEEILRNI